MDNLLAGLVLLSVVVSLGAAAVPDYISPWERIKGGLLTMLVMWLVYAGMSSFYLVGTGLAELEDARYNAEIRRGVER